MNLLKIRQISQTRSSALPIDMERTYTVVTNDYIFAGGDGYVFKGKVIKRTGVEMADALIRFVEDWANQGGIINYAREGRIKVRKAAFAHASQR